MKNFILTTTLLALGVATAAIAGTRVDIKNSQQAAVERLRSGDHPNAEVVNNKNLQVRITDDTILRSCCMPPMLAVSGRITNTSPMTVDYVRLMLSFESAGKVVHTETLYNKKAVSLADDAEVQRLLGEKPHFEPIAPGGSDTFAISIPVPLLPRFDKVELYSTDMRP